VKAIVFGAYGGPEVLQHREVDEPIVGDDEVLIAVRAASVSSGDARVRGMNVPRGFGVMSRLVFGWSKPRQPILGTEMSGVIAAVGKKVTRFAVGAPVFGMTGMAMGCYAERVVMKESGAIALKPANLSFEEAAAMSFGGTTALDFFRRGKLQSGERILINGASGSVGCAAIQLAKHQGAHVTAVCSGANAALVQSLGADAVIDYTRMDFTQNGETYDLIMDNAGTAPFSRSKGSLAPKGRLLLVLAGLAETVGSLFANLTTDKKVIAGPASERAEDLQHLAELATAGKYRPVIDRAYPLEATANAHAYVDTGRKKGNVILTVSNA
jgi:NADPH:quinone reductase-like Zn-dependent oxidoreductase